VIWECGRSEDGEALVLYHHSRRLPYLDCRRWSALNSLPGARHAACHDAGILARSRPSRHACITATLAHDRKTKGRTARMRPGASDSLTAEASAPMKNTIVSEDSGEYTLCKRAASGGNR
jgi:hypothetical protein